MWSSGQQSQGPRGSLEREERSRSSAIMEKLFKFSKCSKCPAQGLLVLHSKFEIVVYECLKKEEWMNQRLLSE